MIRVPENEKTRRPFPREARFRCLISDYLVLANSALTVMMSPSSKPLLGASRRYLLKTKGFLTQTSPLNSNLTHMTPAGELAPI